MSGYYGVAQATAYAINASGQVGVSYTVTVTSGSVYLPIQDSDLVSSSGTVLAVLPGMPSVGGIDNAGDLSGSNTLVSPRDGWYVPYGGSIETLPVWRPAM